VVANLDTDTQNRANAALGELKSGVDFAAVAKKYSDDTAVRHRWRIWVFGLNRLTVMCQPKPPMPYWSQARSNYPTSLTPVIVWNNSKT